MKDLSPAQKQPFISLVNDMRESMNKKGHNEHSVNYVCGLIERHLIAVGKDALNGLIPFDPDSMLMRVRHQVKDEMDRMHTQMMEKIKDPKFLELMYDFIKG